MPDKHQAIKPLKSYLHFIFTDFETKNVKKNLKLKKVVIAIPVLFRKKSVYLFLFQSMNRKVSR